MNIAIYGKGGIGKSTIASNISAYIGACGNRVLQIGCDPKHDSTLLLSNDDVTTVLEKIDSENLAVSDFLKSGKYNVDCIEMGGPAPGVGCAGRGIIAGIKILKDLKIINNEKYDMAIFDILGDVVCGGFFEPLKSGFVDELYIVTSGEFNSLFAANNLCKGYVNCRLADKGVILGGIIANCRGIQKENEIISKFCESVNVPLVSSIPRDIRIEKSTFLGKPLVQMNEEVTGYGDLVDKLSEISSYIFEQNKIRLQPTPITLNELRNLYESIYAI